MAVHINAFNFPAWGTFEKVAVAFLAGMPVVSKPATATSWLAWRMTQIIVDANILPPGSFSLCLRLGRRPVGPLGAHDTLAFTGSADTGGYLRSHDAFTKGSAPMNVEADSLNAAVIGPKAEPGSDLWYLAIRNIVKDMTQKTGQNALLFVESWCRMRGRMSSARPSRKNCLAWWSAIPPKKR